jgi:SH3 domain-containing YSC84-like protein 1
MKQIGILCGMLVLSAGMILAQDSTSTSSSSNDNSAQSTTTTTTTTTNDNANNNANSGNASNDNATSDNGNNSAAQTTDKAQDNAHKKAAVRNENAADAAKDRAKDATTKSGEEHEKAVARLDDAAKDLNQLLAAPDDGIPETVFAKAKCVAVVPSLIKGGFIFGAEHGRGVASCRTRHGWSAPAFFTMTGGSWGAQIGAQAVDLVMLIMNDNGMNQLLSSKFKIGGSASAAAGPVGRQAAADTSWKMNAEILTYSRARGLFAGATLNGTAITEDDNAMTAYYGRNVGFRPALTGKVKDATANNVFTSTLAKSHAEVNAEAH